MGCWIQQAARSCVKYRLLAIGKSPSWVESGVNEYSKRLPNLKLELVAGNPRNTRMQRMLNRCGSSPWRVFLDKSGRSFTSEGFANQCAKWEQAGRDVCLLIGDDVGFTASQLEEADLVWSLSDLTLPHQLARLCVCEQLYRAHTINAGHAYHRA